MPHVEALPDKDMPKANAPMFKALEEHTGEAEVYSEVYADEELADLESVQFNFAFKPLVDVPALRTALELDGFVVSELTSKGSSARTVADVTRHVAMTSPSSVLECIIDDRPRVELPYHAAAAASMIAPALGAAPARAERFATALVDASAAWSPTMRDSFVAILAHSVLQPMMEEVSGQDTKATKTTRALLDAFPSTSPSVQPHLSEWRTWCETTLDLALASLEQIARKKPVPATAAQVAALAKAVGRVPADFERLYRFAGNLDEVTAGAPLEWLGVEHVAAAYSLNRKSKMPASLLPLATDGAGNYSCLDRETGKIMDWDHETREATPLTSTLAWYLTKRVVRPLRAAAEEARAKKKEKGKGLAFGPKPAATSKLAPIPLAVLRGHESDAACFLDDGRIALGGQNSTYLVDIATQAETYIGVGSYCLAFDAPSRRLLLTKWGEVALADAATGKVLSRWKAAIGHWAGALFAAGGSLAITYSATPSIAFWDVAGRKGIPEQDAPENIPAWTLAEGKPVAVLDAHASWVHTARLSGDGALLASGDQDGKVCVWNVAKRSLVGSASFAEPVFSVDFAADGSIFVGLESGKIGVLDARGGKKRTFAGSGQIIDLRVLDDDRIAVLLSDALALVEPAKGRMLCRVPTGNGAHVSRIADVRGDVVLLSRTAKLFRLA